ncbi:hypothetical protein Mal15_41990 [Stieleria maiorica]|uniref:Uncharacterized protein n=1 Tax=Stieleria maiorica TaxID=2795974 RepID=A0A5B9MI05_9BACT|nr:hypothetical protein [Stieleria maiorica]QEG00130.1 hypothetical protein Mal15_41990 [Stieleria maiorica]
MATATTLALFLLVCQVAVGDKVATVHDSPDERLTYMRTTGGSYEVTVDTGRTQEAVTFRDKPVLRFTNPVSGVVDGGLFVWEDSAKRPVAAAQIFIIPGTDDVWLHEFQSLSTRPLRFQYNGRSAWAPATAGVSFESIPGAPQPAATPAARLLQMRRLVRRISAQDDFEGGDEDRLRLMTTPIARYHDDSTIDGAVFVFAHGTDPELFVIIEARSPQNKQASSTDATWNVALAPMTSYALRAELDGKPYWSVQWRKEPIPVTATFKNFVFPPTH